jgi:TetR/AcrR family transcriptional regulator, transcriptional repressor for nem operon
MTTIPKTAKGRGTRDRIVATASALVQARGVADTSLDDVITNAGVSKSQLYHYFEDRSDLLRAVVAYNAESVLGKIGPLDGWKAIRKWFDSLVDLQVDRRYRGGCPIGSLVSQLAEDDEGARLTLVDSFDRWETELRKGLQSMKRQGKLRPTANPGNLATATLAAIQGGLLLTQTRRDPRPLAISLQAAFANLRAHAQHFR